MTKHFQKPTACKFRTWTTAVALASLVAAGSAAQADETLIDLVEDVAPSVVAILSEWQVDAPGGVGDGLGGPEQRPFEEFFRRFGEPGSPENRGRDGLPHAALGSGFILSPDGLIVTNHHVIDDASAVTVRLNDGREFDAEVVGEDPETDLALLSIRTEQALPHVTLGDSDKIRVGENVVAVGNPFGLGGTVTAGIISAKERHVGTGAYAEFLQTDAAINKGNSGGPLFNLKGEVVGVNSAIFSPTGGNMGIGFAVTSNIVDRVTEDLLDDGVVDRGWLGVSVQNISDQIATAIGLKDRDGALVSGVSEGAPAEGTLEVGDVIVAFDGAEIKDSRALPKAVAAARIGDTSEVEVIRNGARVALQVDIGQRESRVSAGPDDAAEAPSTPALGVTVAPLTDTARSAIGIGEDMNGVVVSSLAPSGAAAAAGLQVGDIIVKFGTEEVETPQGLKQAVARTGEELVLVLINRQGQPVFLAIELA
ncbi:MAG: Do family serine endopeptidase [Pseudomonadota bacterium]